MSEKFLDAVYKARNAKETRDLYDDWASTYDAEIAENGYATPGRVADALWKRVSEPTKPVLDFGCGTGLSGVALRAAGFQVIDGMDPSPGMLESAREKGAYRDLSLLDLDDETPIAEGAYELITATGVIGVGAAPPKTFDMLMKALPRGGKLAFSFNDHALADASYEGRLCEWLDIGAARLLSKEYGPHLPGHNLKANVYVVEKT
ncbi:class I SAM-dependent DNA methyltransferase [Lutimaribacter marinistellae]|uniref:Class I SAM-dependent DNA methyltransferase n=1 Tax=Lutimaribacter marinistellae TaxID=1820329 RepID=A0ABV7TMD4_9RHOB